MSCTRVSAIFILHSLFPSFLNLKNQTSNSYLKFDFCLQFSFLYFIFVLCLNCQKTGFHIHNFFTRDNSPCHIKKAKQLQNEGQFTNFYCSSFCKFVLLTLCDSSASTISHTKSAHVLKAINKLGMRFDNMHYRLKYVEERVTGTMAFLLTQRSTRMLM